MTAPTPHPDRAEQTEVVHACPPDGKAVTPCCGRSPFELLRSDRMTADPGLVTCAARAEQSQPGGYPGGLVDPNCARLGGTCDADCRHSGCQWGAPGYTPPEVGAPTWPPCGEPEADRPGRFCALPSGHHRHRAYPPGGGSDTWEIDWTGSLDELRADRDQLRGVIAAAYVDLLAGRVDEAIGALRAAGGQP